MTENSLIQINKTLEEDEFINLKSQAMKKIYGSQNSINNSSLATSIMRYVNYFFFFIE